MVAGHHRVEPERQGTVEDRGELDLFVAAEAGVGGAARGVLRDEVVHDAVVELVR
jgi:hypothetical protein